jgi:hypothetical protein
LYNHELFDQVTELYPHWAANQLWLMFGFPQAQVISTSDRMSSRIVEGLPLKN